MSSQAKQPSLLLPIFLTVFVDMLGVGIIIPVMPQLFFGDDSTFFGATVSKEHRSIMFGYLLASYPFMQFFGAPILGALSDRFGRKPVLQASLIGTVLGYLLFGYAIMTGNLVLLFFSRMVPGFLGGNISIAMSAISDMSTAETRTKNFGIIGAAFGLGFILGPAIGGVLADKDVVSWFNHATPFWFAAALTLFNVWLVKTIFRETIKERHTTKLTFTKGFGDIAKAFSDPKIRIIFAVVLLVSLGFSFFTQFFGAFMIQRFDYTPAQTGMLFGWVGIWLALTQGLIVRRMSGKVARSSTLTVSLIALSVTIGLLLLPNQVWLFYLINPLIAISQGITSPNLTTEVSVQAGPEKQGEILGINQSMVSLGQFIPAIIGGYVNSIDSRMPMLASAIFIGLAWVVYVFVFKARVSTVVSAA